MEPEINALTATPWTDYALIDSGMGRKLERYGQVIVNRPEPQALWMPTLPESEWQQADAMFSNVNDDLESETGRWKLNGNPAEQWNVKWNDLNFVCRLMSFRHMGLFPEQMTHWSWISDRIKSADRPLKILNLFGYTGAASLAAAKAGAQVTHLDASKKAIQWAKENQEASGLSDAPIRWICDDAKVFVARELRRGNTYDGIILDPPKFGRGPDGERWQLEEDLPEFLANCEKLLAPDASFMILTAYAMRLSSMSLGNLMTDVMTNRQGSIDCGELLIKQEQGNRFLSTSLYARWSA